MNKTPISTPHAPAALGPYSQAIAAGDFVFVSGQLGLDPQSGKMVPGAAPEQAQKALDNLDAILTAAGSGLDRVVKVTVLLDSMDDFGPVNEIYATRFPADPPARAAFAVAKLPLGALVEIEAIALAGA